MNGSFVCRRFDCSQTTSQKMCDRCERPPLTKDVEILLTLYRRTRAHGFQFTSGGYFDQPALLVEFMEIIDIEVERYKQLQAERETGDAMKADMVKKLGG